jgi:hypothetical protein
METSRTPGAAVWPDKLITRAEAFAKAAQWPVYARSWFTSADGIERGINLYCGECDRSMGNLRREETVYNGSLDEMLSMVLRHMVQAHDVALNTREANASGT